MRGRGWSRVLLVFVGFCRFLYSRMVWTFKNKKPRSPPATTFSEFAIVVLRGS